MLAPHNGNPVARDECQMTLADPVRLPRPMTLTFHELVAESNPDPYKMDVARFEEHLQVVQEFRGPSMDGPALQVTFDDGSESDHQLAAPLLAKYQISAIFFVTAGQIGVSRQHMSWTQVKDLVTLGHEVQSHTWSHRFLPTCPQETLEEELVRSKETIEDKLALPVCRIAIPYGRYFPRILRACAAAGYEEVYTSDPWMGSLLQEGVRVNGRLSVQSTHAPLELRTLLTLKTLPYLYRQTKSRGKEAIKTLLGENFYSTAWLRRAR